MWIVDGVIALKALADQTKLWPCFSLSPIRKWSIQIRSVAPNPVALVAVCRAMNNRSVDGRKWWFSLVAGGDPPRDVVAAVCLPSASRPERGQGNWIRDNIRERRGNPEAHRFSSALQINIDETQLSNSLEESCRRARPRRTLARFIISLYFFIEIYVFFSSPSSSPLFRCTHFFPRS